MLPRQVFARRADRLSAAPAGESFQRAWAALDPPGSVLDVGSGAGRRLPAAAAPRHRAHRRRRRPGHARPAGAAGRRGRAPARTVPGSWPDVAAQAGPADVVTCYNVTYNVAGIGPFLDALTASRAAHRGARDDRGAPAGHAERAVAAVPRPATAGGPHGRRPARDPGRAGRRPGHRRWRRPGGPDYASFDELVDVTRRRLCLPPERAGEVAEALTESGIDPAQPVDLGSSGREMVTIWWQGTAGAIQKSWHGRFGSRSV